MNNLTAKQLGVLEAIGTFGYLSTRDVAKLAWPGIGEHSAHVMAQTAVSKLARDGWLLARDPRVPPGARDVSVPKTGVTKAYVLTAKGSELLNEKAEEMWCATPLPEGVHSQLWFADGYNLSLREHLVRTPVIDLLHSVLSNKPGLHPVGQRGAARNYRGLQGVSHFDALLVNDDGVLAYGIYLAHPLTARATAQVTTLAREGRPFLVAADRPARVQTLLRWRAEKAPELDARIMTSLPIGILA